LTFLDSTERIRATFSAGADVLPFDESAGVDVQHNSVAYSASAAELLTVLDSVERILWDPRKLVRFPASVDAVPLNADRIIIPTWLPLILGPPAPRRFIYAEGDQ
jgi:hypothetical protein